MSVVSPAHGLPAPDLALRDARQAGGQFARRWWPLGLGLVAVLGGTSYRFWLDLWQLPAFEHGPMMLAIAAWLLWRGRADIFSAESPRSVWSSLAILVPALLLHVLGVRLKAGYIEMAALVPVVAGALHLVGGWPLVRRFVFPLIFIALATPMPAPVISTATDGLKAWVSQAAGVVLHIAGYPVALDGITLRVGPYNLLMADACSGMNSLISLSAVGLLFVHLTGRRTALHMGLILLLILPVAVLTNLVRVLILCLITYHLGDDAGQGFLHEFAGFVMFIVALAVLALMDYALGKLLSRPEAAPVPSEPGSAVPAAPAAPAFSEARHGTA